VAGFTAVVQGFQVKIVKGLWFPTGASRGHSVSSTSMDDHGTGTLVLTNQGFSFIGTNSTRILFSHIISLSFGPAEFCIDLSTLVAALAGNK